MRARLVGTSVLLFALTLIVATPFAWPILSGNSLKEVGEQLRYAEQTAYYMLQEISWSYSKQSPPWSSADIVATGRQFTIANPLDDGRGSQITVTLGVPDIIGINQSFSTFLQVVSQPPWDWGIHLDGWASSSSNDVVAAGFYPPFTQPITLSQSAVWVPTSGSEYSAKGMAFPTYRDGESSKTFTAYLPPGYPLFRIGFDANGNTVLKAYLRWQPPPAGSLTLQGVVTGSGFPVIGVPVILKQNGTEVRRVISQEPDGRFYIPNAPVGDNITLRANLEAAVGSPTPFQVVYGGTGGPLVYAETTPFSTSGAGSPLNKNVLFENLADITTDAAINKDHLDSLAAIYHHTHQAWQLTVKLGQLLDFKLPVDIRAFSPDAGVFWRGPMSNGAYPDADPFVNIEAANGSSLIRNSNRPANREWHEFGHHVMADTFGNVYPWIPAACSNALLRLGDAGCNHQGHLNASTSDSWGEGFAEFYSLLVQKEVLGSRQPWEYRMGPGNVINYESNYRYLRRPEGEEDAVAGLLWDLVDEINMDDASTMENGALAPAGAAAATTYADCVQVDVATLWGILRKNWSSAVPGPPEAVSQNFGYIYDVKHLYDVLKNQGIGAAHSRGRSFDDLDELFIAHGLFTDTSPINNVFDVGEAVGRAAFDTYNYTIRGDAAASAIPARPNRRAKPEVPGSYIQYDAKDAGSGNPVEVKSFIVEVRFAAPFELYNYRYTQPAPANPGLLYYHGPDRQYQATTLITALTDSQASSTPLSFTNQSYAQAMETNPSESFTQHTFQMTAITRNLYLPLIAKNAGGSGAPSPLRPKARPCTP